MIPSHPVPESPSGFPAFRDRIARCLLRDRPRLVHDLERLERRARAGRPHDRMQERFEAALAAAEARAGQRLATSLRIEYPDELPVSARREDILAALAAHPVVIVCGETGSGKTTQLPKMLLEAGYGRYGMIGHTQPRRIAARTLALRIAEELGVPYGQEVGCKVRFGDHVGKRTRVKVMTDGILLAEIRSDPDLLAYDAVLIDEAHERSLNIDFLLGYLKRLSARRPDLKLVITSATIDTERFSRHFGHAPVIDVSGRTWPVEIRYRPLRSEEPDALDRDLEQGILDAVDELAAEGPGDVLVFLPGEREIRETAELLRKHHPPGTEILPLFGRLSLDRQRKVFAPHSGRRIVLATNVAETSLTVPGIRYVVDSGLVRISRYSVRSKVQRLPVEPVSQASANQRAGRCGRVGPGICIRLYSEEDFQSRPAFTDPEIRRTNLAGVILQMADRGLGRVEDFPFLDPPDARQIRDGYRTLVEIGAMDEAHRITETGRRLARLPLDVRIGRMLLAAEQEGCLEEVAVIASALSVQDPREFSPEHPERAREKHALFADPRSDFVGWLKLWQAWRTQARHLSGSKLRAWCKEHWLSWMRMREWQDIHRQIRELLADMGLRFNTQPAEYDAIHRALITGLPGHVARHEEGTEYLGARGMRLHLFPGTGIEGRPKWVLAAEIVETSRRFARTVAAIRPEWVERAVPHLLRRTRTDPHWDRRQGRVVCRETVSLYGLVLASGRRVDYGRIDPAGARKLFLEQAIVGCDLRRDWPFQEHNRALIASVREQEARRRRPDLLVPLDRLTARFEALLPDRIRNERDFNRWYARLPESEQARWFLKPEEVRRETASPGDGFPDVLRIDGLELPLRYHLAPGEPDDGVTAQIPLALLPQLAPEPFEWLVPGLLEEKVTALIRSLPKSLRRHFVPAPDFARAALEAMTDRKGSLRAALARELERMTGVAVPDDAWREELLAAHLHMRFAVLDAEGREIAAGRDLAGLQSRLADRAGEAFRASTAASVFEARERVHAWDFGDLPECVTQEVAGVKLRAWPALVREGEGVALRLLPEAEAARRAHREGVIALFMAVEGRRFRTLARQLPEFDRMALALTPLLQAERLRRDLLWRIAEGALEEAWEEDIRTQAAFEAAATVAAPRLMAVANRLCPPLADAAARWHGLRKRLSGRVPPAWLAALADMRSQLDLLVYSDFLRELPAERLLALPRYLKGLEMRLERLDNDPVRDRQRQQAVEPWWEDCRRQIEGRGRAAWQRWPCRWLVEEYRVSLFAQSLGTAEKVSPERLRKACGGR